LVGITAMSLSAFTISCSVGSLDSHPTETTGSETASTSTLPSEPLATDRSGPSSTDKEIPPLSATDMACTIRPIEPTDGFSPFYDKGCSVNGFWILASENVDDEAILVSAELVAATFAHDPAIATALSRTEVRLGIIGRDQVVTDMPEFNDLSKSFPETDWDGPRGIGASIAIPFMAVGEENVLCDVNQPQLGEDILLHEFAHVLDLFVYRRIDRQFGPALDRAYADAMAKGAWADTYSTTDEREYWAEAVQAYFARSLSADPATGIYGPVDTRSEVMAEDPALFDLIDERLGGLTLPPNCHDEYAEL